MVILLLSAVVAVIVFEGIIDVRKVEWARPGRFTDAYSRVRVVLKKPLLAAQAPTRSLS